MITAWLLYAMFVGVLLGLGGLALESVLRTHGLPSRWIWFGTILLSVGWPLGHWAWDGRSAELPAVAGSSVSVAAQPPVTLPLLPLDPMTVEVAPTSVLRSLDGPVKWAWALSTGALLLLFSVLLLRTHHLRSRWSQGVVEGHSVLFSDEWGPAVVGFFRPQVVLPRWCEKMDEGALNLILDHELEHVRAGDLRLIFLAGLLPLLFPLHLPIWWQLARLRTAIEGDCDLRVLGRNPGRTRPYVDLLLHVGERFSQRRPMAAMLSEPYETLKRRIRIMTMPLPKRPWVRGMMLVGGGTVLVALAGWAPGPVDAGSEVEPGSETVSPEETLRELGQQELPTFTPYTVWPTIGNMEEVVDALEGEYPPLLKDAGIDGEVQVWFFVDEEGEVRRMMVNQSSGHKALDDAALQASSVIEFTPALNRDQQRPFWISVPVVYTMDDDPELDTNPMRWPALPSVDPVPAGGQTTEVTGYIRDESTDQPLAFVQVFVLGTGRGTLTNAEGRFVIRGVPVGDRYLAAQLIGFGQGLREVPVGPDAVVEVDFDLEPQAISARPVVVKGG